MKKLLIAMSIFCFATAASAAYKDGTYTSEAQGHVGPVKVQVTVKDGKVSEVKVIKHNDTVPLMDAAEQKVGNAVLKTQSAENLPRVTGASMSGGAISKAVKDCLSQAKTK